MAFAFDVTSNIPRITQSGTDTNLDGITTAINAVPVVSRSTAVTTTIMRKPPTPTGFWYRCSAAGTTAATAPTYGTTLGGSTTDGTSVWVAFKAPDIQLIGTKSHYYMPDVRMNITGTLTNENNQISDFTCWDIFLSQAGAYFKSGKFASDGVTPLYDGLHFVTTRLTGNNTESGINIQLGTMELIGGEVQTANAVSIAFGGAKILSYNTRWRSTRIIGGTSSNRFRAYSSTSIFRNCEFYDMAYDLFVMPQEFSVVARDSEYVAQYVGGSYGGVDALFKAYALNNPDGSYDFDNYAGGYAELYNCSKAHNLNVVTQLPSNRMCTPLYQEIKITAKDTAGVNVQNVRFTSTDSPANSPSQTFITAGNLKTWDFMSPLSYQATTNASGVALSSPISHVWYYTTSLRKNLRFPLGVNDAGVTLPNAIYQGRAYNYKTMNVSVFLGSNTIQDVSAGMISLDTATTVSETAASAITGINLVADGRTGGNITISSNKTYQDIWNYYRWWISQFANNFSNDVWTCTGGTLNIANWNVVVNAGVNLTDSANITKIQSSGSIAVVDASTMPYLFNAGGVLQPTGILLPSTVLGVLDTYTGSGSITAVYQDVRGTSTIWEFGATAEPIIAGTSLAIYDSTGTTKYYNAVTTDGVYRYYIAPQSTGATYTYAIERYGYKREEGTFPSNAGGILFYVPSYGEDVGITEATKATVAAYTTLADTAQIYDATANFRLSETGIKLGQLVARDGTYLDFGNFNVKIKDDASAIVAVSSGTITYKSIVINESTKYNAMKATPPKTITPTDTEIINVLIEDANGDSKLAILGGDNLGYELWKITTATATDDYATGTLLTTLATNDQVFRFIGVSGFDIVGRDISSGVRRRTSMLKGSYEQAFYVGNQIQLATDAPQLLETIDKLEELTLKVDTNLDVKVSTRLADADYIDPATAQDVWEYTTRTLTSAGAAGATLAEIEASTVLAKEATSEAIKAKTDKMQFNAQNHIASNVHQLQAGAITDIQNGLALETTSQDIKSKVDTLNNTDLTGIATATNVTDAKDEIILEIQNNLVDLSGIATTVDVTTAKDEIITELGNIDVDNVAIANEVWNQEPERLKQVATVETTGDQLASFNNA